MTGMPERTLAARDAWLAAMVAHEAHGPKVRRPEAHRLWLEYLDFADPERARKARRILKHGEQGAAKTAGEYLCGDHADMRCRLKVNQGRKRVLRAAV